MPQKSGLKHHKKHEFIVWLAEKFYIRTDLMPQNEAWVAPNFGNTPLTERYNQIAAMVKEKTSRAIQTKDRERVNKKTGKVTIVHGSRYQKCDAGIRGNNRNAKGSWQMAM